MKILWMSNAPWVPTGYGNQTKLFTPRLNALPEHDVTVFAFYGLSGSALTWNGMKILPHGLDIYGQDIMSVHAKNTGSQIILSLIDAWVVKAKNIIHQDIKWCVPAGTLVQMADGTSKEIEKLKIGDMVLSSKNEQIKTSQIKNTWKIPSNESGEIIEVITDGGLFLEITSENDIAIKTDNGLSWIDAASLIPGMVVYCIDSNPLYKRSNSHGNKSNNTEHSNRQNKRFSDKLDTYGDGLCGWNSRRRGNNFNIESSKKGQEESSLYFNSEVIGFEYERAPIEMATRCSVYEGSIQNQTGKIQERAKSRMDTEYKRISLLQFSESNRTLYDCEEGISTTGNEFYREQTVERINEIQRSIYGEGTENLVEDSIYKSQNIVSVRRKGRPYDFVYDITTEEGNFFAGGILVHNCPWFPVDSEPLPIAVGESIANAHKRIVFTRFAERMVNERGMDCYYVPHGVDTKIFKPLKNKAELREKYGLPKDKYIVGMVAANKGNPPRKAFYAQFQAFAEFKKKHDDAFLYLHTTRGEHGEYEGINIPAYMSFLGLKENEDYKIAEQYTLLTGNYGDEQMVELYNCMDVHMLVSMGEGFGIPILEAQACGTPVIVGDWTAMSELCFGGWKVDKKDAELFYTNLVAHQYNPHMRGVLDKLEQAYEVRGNTLYNENARKGALPYDVDRIVEKYWKPILKEIEESLPEPIETRMRKHNWSNTGVYNADGTISFPCLDCFAELMMNPANNYKYVIENGFNHKPNGVELDLEDHPTGSVSKIICREIQNDYKLDLDYKDGDVVIDIGAQVGVVSAYLGKKYPFIKIIALEPVKENYDRLLRNIEANGVKNVIALNMAVTSDGRNVVMDGSLDMNSGSMTIYGKGKKDVESTTIELLMKAYDIENIRLLKIDAEGSEYEILESSVHLLDRISSLRGEIHPMNGKNQQDLMTLIRSHISDVKMTVLR